MVKILRYYTNKGYVDGKISIDDPAKFFDSVVVEELNSGEYVFGSDEMDILAHEAGVTGFDGNSIVTKYGTFKLTDISETVKTVLSVIYCGKNGKDAVILLPESFISPNTIADRLFTEADKYDVGLAGRCLVYAKYNNKRVKVNDSFETTLGSLMRILRPNSDWDGFVKLEFECRGHIFNINTGTKWMALIVDNYMYTMLEEALTGNKIETSGNIIIGTREIADSWEKIEDIKELYNKIKGATIIDFNGDLGKALNRAMGFDSEAIFVDKYPGLYTYLGIFNDSSRLNNEGIGRIVYGLDERVIDMGSGKTRYEFTMPDYIKDTLDNEDERKVMAWAELSMNN